MKPATPKRGFCQCGTGYDWRVAVFGERLQKLKEI